MDYQKTLNLPQTDFPMKAGLTEKEPKLIKKWLTDKLYEQIRKERHGKEKFILHDGPPYANGNIHLGHALNKILKDIIVKIKTMQGFDSPYVPGWDCHGLPIEHQVVKKLGAKAKQTAQHDIRQLCRDYANGFVQTQSAEFQRLGVFGDFQRPYLTLSPDYEAKIVEVFGELFDQGYIYRGKKPIYWSPTTVTALAEAEIEYFDIESPSVYVKFPVAANSLPPSIPNRDNTHVVIWTTTPWTLPANLAVCFHPTLPYAAYQCGSESFIVAQGLAEEFFQKISQKADGFEGINRQQLEKLDVRHPFLDRKSLCVFGEHVTLETGTGVVHTAPGHGQEDYQIGLEYGLDIYCPVDEYGRFTDDFPEMAGENVFKANERIIELLQVKNCLLKHEPIVHSYPHGWRDKKPVIFRATEQWFFKMDHQSLRQRGLKAIEKTRWIPSWGQNRIQSMVEKRPDWCLSRQRAWGVPIPAFRHIASGKTLMTKETIDFFTNVIRQQGLDCWFTKKAHDLLPDPISFDGITYYGADRIGVFEQHQDILDVWFDSGVSSFAVLVNDSLSWPANVYLEGSDQHRGWFQSSLWPAVALRQQAPYEMVVTHGFVLDENGRAMSKSEGNVIAPDKVIQKYGADILRLWVASEDFHNDIKLGWKLMDQMSDSYRKIRNSFRFMLGNLYDFSENDRVDYQELPAMDRWALYKVSRLQQSIHRAYQQYEFHQVYHNINNFFVQDLSSTYFDIAKDILYVEGKSSQRRRCIQTVLDAILRISIKLVAPILCFTAEEVYLSYASKHSSVHLEVFDEIKDAWLLDSMAAEIEHLLQVRFDILKVLEGLRNQKIIGKSLEAQVKIFSKDSHTQDLLKKYQAFLAEFFITSKVELLDNEFPQAQKMPSAWILAQKANGEKCPRCWYLRSDIGVDSQHPDLCGRCAMIVKG